MAATKLVRAAAALAAIALLELGIPTALLAVGVLPSWAQLTGALTGPDNGTLFLGALTLLGWAAWAALTLSFTVEAAAVLRHRSAPRLPVLGVTQHLAASLVAAIVVLLPSTGALASAVPATAATLHLPHAAATTPERAAANAARAGAGSASPDEAGGTHTVASSDETLWGIAEHYLGDGLRWREIAALNQGVPQADGQTLTAHTVHLAPGWTLRLPADSTNHPLSRDGKSPRGNAGSDDQAGGTRATSSHAHRSTGGGHERVHVVRPGETLSQIAETDLGDADDYPAIYAASTHTLQPDGAHLTDPDLILPGWRLTIPRPGTPITTGTTSTPGAPGTVHAGGTHGGSGSGHHPAPGTPTADPTRTPPPSAVTTAPTGTPTGTSTTAPTATATTPTASPPPMTSPPPSTTAAAPAPPAAAHTTSESAPGSELRIGAAVAALLAGGLLGGYAIKRALQQRNRRPGQTIAVPAQTSSLEQVLAAQADVASADLLDRALRTLAAHLSDGEPLPQLDAARVGHTGIQLRASGPPLPPFTAGPAGWWTLDPAATVLDPAAAGQIPAPYPLLATLGAEADGTLLLVNLAAAGTVLLDGTPAQVREVARALALEAATCPWGQELQVLSSGLVDTTLPAMMATGRLRRLDTISHAVTDLADQLLTAHQDPDAALPWILVASDSIDQDTAWELANLIHHSPAPPIALALPGRDIGPLFPHALRLDCSSTDPQTLPTGVAPVRLQRVTETEYQILSRDLSITEQPAHPAAGAWTHVPSDTDYPPQPTTDPPIQDAATTPNTRKGPTTAPAGDQPGHPVTPFLAFAATTTDSARHSSTSLPRPLPAANAPGQPGAPAAPAQTRDDAPAQVTARPAPLPDTADPHAPEIRILGPVDVTGLGTSGRGKRLAEVAAYLYLRPGRTRDDLAYAMNPNQPWGERSVKQRLSDLRSLLGPAPDGTPRLARSARNGALPTLTGVRSDWDRFQKLAERGLLAGPAGVGDLEAALALVRGRPFAGSTAAWSMPDHQEMVSRIVDTAHTLARYRTAAGDLHPARAAIAKGIDVHPTAELLYRDWIALEAAHGSHSEVQHVISRLQDALRTLDVEMEHATRTLIEAVYQRDLKGSA
ncbi:LysM peptidoglycan-binding domain-containing protein [Streptacidiphilus rugosus]|uniref:LysM peptidoglycan-binding domain-containing protein n=1 Tax=Streptacidiphilus rugosus TaxID=405783 RepID=UPI00055D91C0|nr:LysM peptidoglycan-binding domain-containing protein [Streptacidiphilus rugosus]